MTNDGLVAYHPLIGTAQLCSWGVAILTIDENAANLALFILSESVDAINLDFCRLNQPTRDRKYENVRELNVNILTGFLID